MAISGSDAETADDSVRAQWRPRCEPVQPVAKLSQLFYGKPVARVKRRASFLRP